MFGDQQPEDLRPESGGFTAPVGQRVPYWRARWQWIVSSLVFGAPAGPFVSAMVNHGQPHVLVASVSGAFVLVIGVFFTALTVLNMGWRWQPALGRVALVLSFGSVLFMLPHAVSLPATGEFWWATVLERYAVCCIPYPFTG